MNVNKDIVNRALIKAGQEPLTDEEYRNEDATRWRLIKSYYLPTILITLENTEWTSQKRRKKLEKIELTSEEKELSPYLNAYQLPIDCRKPIALKNSEEYAVEGRRLLTNGDSAVLLYVSDGYIGEADDSGVVSDDDFPNYEDFKPDATLEEYLVTKMASEIALKITGDNQLYNLLYGEAQIMEDRAIKSSAAQGHSKETGNEWWSDLLGMQ